MDWTCLVGGRVDAAVLRTAFVTGSYASLLGMAIMCFPNATYGTVVPAGYLQ